MAGQIGIGTVNIVFNAPKDEREAIGQAAFRKSAKSVGAFLRKLILAGAELECPELAAQLKTIRLQYYGSAALLAIFCGIMVGSWFANDSLDVRRARSSARVRQVRTLREGRIEA